MHTTHSFRTGIATLRDAMAHIARHSEREAVARLRDLIDEIADEIDNLPHAVQDAEYQHCPNCHHYRVERNNEPYGERVVVREYRECTAPEAGDCPIVQRCGLGKPVDFEIPEYLRRQAS